jgi:hypothetical protein
MASTWYNPRNSTRNVDFVQRRKTVRRAVRVPALALADGTKTALCPCTVIDISAGGAKIKVDNPEAVPTIFLLVLSRGARTVRRCEVRWRSATEIGVRFLVD